MKKRCIVSILTLCLLLVLSGLTVSAAGIGFVDYSSYDFGGATVRIELARCSPSGVLAASTSIALIRRPFLPPVIISA